MTNYIPSARSLHASRTHADRALIGPLGWVGSPLAPTTPGDARAAIDRSTALYRATRRGHARRVQAESTRFARRALAVMLVATGGIFATCHAYAAIFGGAL